MKYIAKIDTIINYKCFNAGDDVPEAFVTERLIDIGVLERIQDDIPKIGTGAKPKKSSKKILTEDTSDVETTVETTDKAE
jgi:hypothetical protein